MKRFSLMVMLSLVFVLNACGNDLKGDAQLNDADLTEFENGLLDLMSGGAFAFDLEVNNDDLQEIHSTVDYYTNGTFNRHVLDFNTAIDPSKGQDPVRIIFIPQQIDDQHVQWTSSIMSNGVDTAEQSTFTSEAIPIETTSYASGPTGLPAPLVIDKKKIVASTVYSDKNGITTYQSIETEQDIQQATDYEDVFLVTMELH
ncbi:hypothetical protein F3157_14855 [Virgibacillus dakarensis]|uniref:Lipoprotein n=1 Tax=Lentibacillus populi TaxID=1827502 RepID=A0A9W5X704_9BACI|nr:MULTISPECIES: hypothetical protein [Bacillaceae]MBT2217006.1 hypothetical protein [Virgibacillus dakarensis]MTW86929.1 hypothetical protein [Virgibacillus dakarensis]GGB52556.1 hypothetical protein GCM10011409_32670 [Lentibacillus populi]